MDVYQRHADRIRAHWIKRGQRENEFANILPENEQQILLLKELKATLRPTAIIRLLAMGKIELAALIIESDVYYPLGDELTVLVNHPDDFKRIYDAMMTITTPSNIRPYVGRLIYQLIVDYRWDVLEILKDAAGDKWYEYQDRKEELDRALEKAQSGNVRALNDYLIRRPSVPNHVIKQIIHALLKSNTANDKKNWLMLFVQHPKVIGLLAEAVDELDDTIQLPRELEEILVSLNLRPGYSYGLDRELASAGAGYLTTEQWNRYGNRRANSTTIISMANAGRSDLLSMIDSVSMMFAFTSKTLVPATEEVVDQLIRLGITDVKLYDWDQMVREAALEIQSQGAENDTWVEWFTGTEEQLQKSPRTRALLSAIDKLNPRIDKYKLNVMEFNIPKYFLDQISQLWQPMAGWVIGQLAMTNDVYLFDEEGQREYIEPPSSTKFGIKLADRIIEMMEQAQITLVDLVRSGTITNTSLVNLLLERTDVETIEQLDDNYINWWRQNYT